VEAAQKMVEMASYMMERKEVHLVGEGVEQKPGKLVLRHE